MCLVHHREFGFIIKRNDNSDRPSKWKWQSTIVTIQPTRCTNFSNLFLEWNSACFGQFLCPLSGVFHCTNSSGLLTACTQAVSKPVCHDGKRNSSKPVGLYSKNKFEKLVHLVGFIVRIYHDARSPKRQTIHYCQYLLPSPLTNSPPPAYRKMSPNHLTLHTQSVAEDSNRQTGK